MSMFLIMDPVDVQHNTYLILISDVLNLFVIFCSLLAFFQTFGFGLFI